MGRCIFTVAVVTIPQNYRENLPDYELVYALTQLVCNEKYLSV